MLNIQFLQEFPIFTGLTEEKLVKLSAVMKEVEYPGGSVIIKDGDRSNEMFVLLEGDVEITKQMVMKPTHQDVDSKDKSLIRLSAKFHACFGEMALFEENSERSATVSSLNHCKLAVITRADFTRLIDNDHEVGYIVFRNLAGIISDRLKRANKDILKLTTAFVMAVEK